MAYFYGKGIDGPVQTNIFTSPGEATPSSVAPGVPTGETTGLCTVHADCPPGQMCAQGRCVPAPSPDIGLAPEAQPGISAPSIPVGVPSAPSIPVQQVGPPRQPPIQPPIEPPIELNLACQNGTCAEVELNAVVTPEATAACIGKQVGQPCGTLEIVCQSDAECAEGQRCIDGRCQEPPDVELACSGGACIEIPPGQQATVEQKAACQGKIAGDSCGVTGCTSDAECPPNEACQNGQCVPTAGGCTSNADCPEGKTCVGGSCVDTEVTTGCQSNEECPAGQVCVSGNCVAEGVTACETNAECAQGQNCVNGRCEEIPGWYEWPPELQALYQQLMENAQGYAELGQYGGLGEYALPESVQGLISGLSTRAEEVLGMTPGFSEEALANLFGQGFEDVQGRTGAQRESLTNLLQRTGQSGTGVELEQMNKLAWRKEKALSDVKRDVMLLNEAQKRQDLQAYTKLSQSITNQLASIDAMTEQINMGRLGYGMDMQQLSQSIFGQGMDYNSLQEAINAARRGEQSDAMNQFMVWLNTMLASWAQ